MRARAVRSRLHTHTHTHICKLCVFVCVGVCARATRVCVRVCECRRISGSVCLRVRAGLCARVCERARVCGSLHADVLGPCVRACLRICVRAQGRVCARTRVRASVRSCARASVFCRSIGKHLRAMCVCVGVFGCVGMLHDCLCMPRRCEGTEWALWGPAVLISRPAAARARLRSGATGFRCRARLLQAEPSAAAPSRRNGLRDHRTRP
jgi:hypothetical protein